MKSQYKRLHQDSLKPNLRGKVTNPFNNKIVDYKIGIDIVI